MLGVEEEAQWGGLDSKLKQKGQAGIVGMVVVALMVVLVVSILPVISTITTSGAMTRLLGQGYVVLAAGEYDYIYDTLAKLLVQNENEDNLFPESVSGNCTLTAGNGVDTFGAWTEIVDSSADTLSSKFTEDNGFIEAIMTHDYSKDNEVFIIEIAYGDAKVIIGRCKVRSDWTYRISLNSGKVLEDETIYYRMKAETALATLQADFRYYYDPVM